MRTFFDLPRPASLSLLTASILVAACKPVVIGGSGSGGGSTSSADVGAGGAPWVTTTTSVASSSSGTPTTSGGGTACASTADEGLPPSACTPTSPACGAATSVCLATADADGAPSFGLRVAHLGMTAPAAFTKGIVKSIFQSSTLPNLPACNVGGSGTFNWLLRFDTAAGTLTTGAAKPVSDPSSGYAFIHETLTLGAMSFPVAPITLSAPVDAACGVTSTAGDVLLPFYGDVSGTMLTIFPLRSLRFVGAHVTPDHNCVGAYDAAGLDPANACAPDDTHPAFLDDGQVEAFIALEDADAVLVPPLNESLCVLLTGDPGNYATTGPSGWQVCRRDVSNHILFQGDWCTATNQPAAGGCADAVRFAATFAASGTEIH